MIGDRSCWGRGLATDTLRCLSAYAIDSLDVRKLSAGALAPNITVIKAFERIGFQQEGRIRQKSLIEETYVDYVLMGCFASELVRG